jgi:large subunit ribosomal protein L31
VKAKIHPTYYPDAKVTCASCGTTWTTGSTKKEIRVDICSNCHPFFTGESQRILDIEGQVDRFYKKLTARQTYVEQQKVKEELKGSPERPIEELALSTRAIDSLKKAASRTSVIPRKIERRERRCARHRRVWSGFPDGCQEEIALARL